MKESDGQPETEGELSLERGKGFFLSTGNSNEELLGYFTEHKG